MILDLNSKLRVLQGALRFLGPNGENWKKHSYGANTTPNWCLAGSLAKSAVDLGLVDPKADFIVAADQLTRATSLHQLARDNGYTNIPEFNDSYDTNFEDVRALLEERIAQLEGRS